MAATLPNLSTAELETLLAALVPRPGAPGSPVASPGDTPAFLARAGLAAGPVNWSPGWKLGVLPAGARRPC